MPSMVAGAWLLSKSSNTYPEIMVGEDISIKLLFESISEGSTVTGMILSLGMRFESES